jgi:hypothetical protein
MQPDEYGIKLGLNRGVQKEVYHAGLSRAALWIPADVSPAEGDSGAGIDQFPRNRSEHGQKGSGGENDQ